WSETENNKLLFEMTSKYGTPYFSNYINSDMEPSDVRSMCCRLRLDLRELRKKSGGYFGSGESTGSIGVVTINLPKIAYLAADKEDFYRRLDKLMDIAARSLSIKRQTVSKFLNEGLYPYTKRYLGSFDNHFSTIGLLGMNEVGLNAKWLRKDLTHKATQDFAAEVLSHMRDRLSDYQELYGDLYNLEATPAESTSYRLAKHDKSRYPDIITAHEGATPYYTNSSHLPVGFTDDVFEALDIQDRLQPLYTSGTVFHTFLGEKLPDWKAAANLVRKIAENYELPYYTLSPTYSVCADHGYLTGEQYTCPHCGKKTEVYSRITGYYRPVQNWNDGKSQEFADRKNYVASASSAPSRTAVAAAVAVAEPVVVEVAPVTVSEDPMLFVTKTCPNCRIVKPLLDKAGIKYQVLDVAEHQELAKQYDLQQAPTLVADGQVYTGVAAIKNWMKG
ncbi:MAG: ribonucleoside triphosphate reductase, partial [Clostridia bacterium]|nr:ribonucleoside triphosphate reductase [Clostridia bacterium]